MNRFIYNNKKSHLNGQIYNVIVNGSKVELHPEGGKTKVIVRMSLNIFKKAYSQGYYKQI